MIRIERTRFGTMEVDEETLVHLPLGLVGFPSETRFALIRGEGDVAHLQSVSTPRLALPVVDGCTFGNEYPSPTRDELAKSAGLDATDVILLVPVATRPGERRLFANLLAPIVVDAKSRKAAQVVLDPRRYSASTPL